MWLAGGLILILAGSAQAQATRPTAAERLHELFEDEWEYTLRTYPEFASRLGDKRYNDQWTDNSLDAHEKRHEHNLGVLERLGDIDPQALSEQDRLNYRLFEKDYHLDVEAYPYRRHLMPLDQMWGVQTINQLADALSFDTVKDYEDWITRLRKLPRLIDETIALMKAGIEAGRIHPRVIMERVPDQVDKHVVDDPVSSLFYDPFRGFPERVAEEDRRQLRTAARRAIAEHVVPAYRRLHRFLTERYLPAAPERVGIGHQPQGKELYAFLARRYTTTDLTPKKIHELGLAEVRRIRREMDAIIEQVGFDGGFDAFLAYLREDPRFYYDDPDELLEAYRALCKRIDPKLVKLFERLPRVPYGVEPIPEHTAPDAPTAYYRRPAADGSRAGTVFVNLYQPQTRPTYEMTVLMLHEGVPGHHLQIALAMELGELPQFRRHGGYTAYVEGWGLYSESLGEEMSVYDDPYTKFGQLTYEMWRACRLVVDTGMHAFGWTRQRAIDYLLENVAKNELDVTNEIDRYIAWPGQALAYKIGELKIKELRRRASQRLGRQFDLRAFHNTLLDSGAVPLDVLEELVDNWIAAQTARAASP